MLQQDIKNWARSYALSDISTLQITDRGKNNVISKLDSYFRYRDWETLVSGTKGYVRKLLPRILVEALLAKDIFENIFGNPFFCFDEETKQEEQSRSSFGTQLLELYHEMQKVDKARAHVWRSDTLRLLNTPTESGLESGLTSKVQEAKIRLKNGRAHPFRFPGPEPSLTSKMRESRKRVSMKRAEDFLQGPVQSLRGKLNNECEKSLAEIYIWAAELAALLWTERAYMTIDRLPRLDVFSMKSPEMLAHPSHQIYEKYEKDDRLDQNNILLVVYPLVSAFGYDDGDSYDQDTVWAEGIVLIEDRLVTQY
ncbi:conserved hypothetical protein [Talaromyces stipitatus ATCC 10500]|uniref:Uncharacterized protein n=1 Tax=Talaromyces stipitatus (strain ATCC 10500 / CBS 375.48 / QM 6759 / NRRL 1006) TaxID=441959 RepID=B8MUE0_TALSN|nr:uncharacterized protein TSTA_108320 [Talaromyces stipitatus ATCC 10500]EED11644.1 conserved hypothetical protein [Talaromyces stipitatus ATCC 10500]